MRSIIQKWMDASSIVAEDTVLEYRESAIQQFFENYELANSRLALEGVTALQGGESHENPFISNLLEFLTQFDGTYPNAFEKHKFDIQCLTGAIFEIVLTDDNFSPKSKMTASLLISNCLGLIGNRLKRKQHYYDLIKNLHNVAFTSVHRQAISRRNSSDEASITAEIPPIPTDPTELTNDLQRILDLLSNLNQRIQALEYSSDVKFEELEIYWWTIARRSKTHDMLFSKLSDEEATFSAGIELGDLVLLPPLSNFKDIFLRVFQNTSEDTPIKISVENLISKLDLNFLEAFLPDPIEIINSFPMVFPLHWAANSKYNQNEWPKDFFKVTGLAKSTELYRVDWATQLAMERVCIRYLKNE